MTRRGNNVLVFTTTYHENGKFISGTYEQEFPNRTIMLQVLAKFVRRGVQVVVK